MPTTEETLALSLRDVLKRKPVDKITVKDIVTECNLTRQTFYNHFADIYELVEYAACTNTRKILDKTASYDKWQCGFYTVMTVMQNNKTIVKNTYQSNYRDLMEKYIFKVIYSYVIDIVEKLAEDMNVAQKHKDFIAHFYTLALLALIHEWVQNDLKEDPKKIVQQVATLVQGDFKNDLQKYAK